MLQTLLKAFLIVVISVPVVYYLYTGWKAFNMERGDFLPTPYQASPGGRAALEAMLDVAEPVSWQLDGQGTQQAYYRPAENGTTLIYLHGSPGSGAGFHSLVAELAADGIGALVIDLPGYGASDGQRTWQEHYEASVRAGMEFLLARPEVNPDRIVVFGYSQGANIAARAAARESRVSAIVLLAGYTNLYDQLIQQFRWRLPGIGLFAVAAARQAGVDLQQMDTLAALKQVPHKPLLVISGTNDHVIPVAMAEALAAAAENSTLILVESAGHVDIMRQGDGALSRRIAAFTEAVLN